MQRYLRPIVLLIALAFIAVAYATHPAYAQDNLLQNPGFEGNYTAWLPQYGTAQMAANWTPWWVEDGNHEPLWAQPEYKPAERQFFPSRVVDGERAQQYFTFFKSHYAGMYQQVFNVTPGQTYRFTIWTQVWSSTETAGDTSVGPANPRLHIGIDPTGAAWPGAVGSAPPTVVWSGEVSMTCVIDNWCPVSIDVTAQNDVITVYTRSSPDFANIHNDLYFDAASLTLVGPPPTATPLPTNTPGPATDTPVPTDTPAVPPTDTPAPATDTPTPAPATDTPEPTATSLPTETPLPTATSLPPTDTPQAIVAESTATPVAVAEVQPTATPTSAAGTDSAENDSSSPVGLVLLGAGVLLLIGLGGAALLKR